MRTLRTLTLTLVLVLGLQGAALADVVLRPHDPQAAQRLGEPPATNLLGEDASFGLNEKLDEPADILIVPFFEVDTTSGVGTTTLFAVRNSSPNPLTVEARYLSRSGDVLREDDLMLAPRETYTRNIRDAGLPAGPDGFARGYVALILTSPTMNPNNLTGDFIKVDVGNNFATGDRLVSFADLCEEQEIRFLDFGEDTVLRLLINTPRGSDPMSDPPSVTVTPYTESGSALSSTDIYASDFSVSFPSSVFTGESFGTLVFDFSTSGGGIVFAEYSNEGRYSVGMNGACTVQ